MQPVAIPITQKLLVNAGGWPAMKGAQQLHQAGRVSEATYDPPLLSGVVREGNRNLRSGLRVKSASDVENICTCRESHEWGRICAHALAVGLAYIERLAPKKETAITPVTKDAPSAGPRFVEIGMESAIPVALHFILPPNFESAWAKGQLMLVTEVELNGRRAMPGTLSPQAIYACDNHDLAALDVLGPLNAMAMLSRAEFLRLLNAWRGHPRVTFGKKESVQIMAEPARAHVRLSRDRAEAVTIELKKSADEQLLVAGEDAWLRRGLLFQELEEGLPLELRALAEGSITFRGEKALQFLAFGAPQLSHWFEVETTGDVVLPEIRTATPRFVLNLEGSLREIRAQLRAEYAGGSWPVASSAQAAPSFIRDPAQPTAIFLRDTRAESAAFSRLEALGFTQRGDRLVLTNENSVARFFAFEVPRLEAEWQVHLSAQAATASRELQPLAPKIEIVGSGEDWFELRYSLGAPDGQLFSASELQRLLRSGQSKARLRNGATAVFDPEAIGDFEEVLRDCDPRQNQPGTYRIDRAHASFIADTAEADGARTSDLRHALRRFADTGAAEALPALGNLGTQLREYQQEGVEWLWRLAQNRLGGILADEMGLGKTVQALAFLRANQGSTPALIVCPTSLLTNWRNEARRFVPELKVVTLAGASRHERFSEIAGTDLVLTSYALLQRDAERYRALEFSTVILDEAQHIKNPDTQNAQAAFGLRARHRFVLTGTPMENSVRDLWSLMNFVLPGYLGARADFRERYEQPLARGAAPEVQRRLARRMRPFLLRRKKSEVAKDLPEKIEQQLLCDLTAPQRAAYDGLLREIQTGLTTGDEKDGGAIRMKMLLGLLRLRQVCCDLRLLEANPPPGGAQVFPSAKLELLDELLGEAIDGGHRVLVFSQFVTMLALIRKRLQAQSVPFAYLDGQTKDRQAVVDQFQSNSAVPVFLMSLKAGGVGLNLSAADTVIHFDPWWNYAAEAQATDRAHRIGQTRVVTAYKLITRETVEEKIVKLQARKRSASEGVIGNEEPLMSGLTTQDLEELLS